MSWLEDTESTYEFTCKKCGHKIQETVKNVKQDLVREWVFDCTECSSEDGCTYTGFQPRKLGGMIRTTFEKNGRKAVRTTFGAGGQFVRSQTKENTMNGQGSTSALTKGCQDASNKVTQDRANDYAKAVMTNIKRSK